MTTRKIQPYRHLAEVLQAVIILGLPFIKIGGESALRFDLASLRLYFFGRAIWMQEFFIVLTALLFFTFLIILITVLFGRIWCGWVCPQTVLTDLTRFMRHAGRKNIITRAALLLTTLFISSIAGASLIWYFVSPYEFFERLANNHLGQVITWSWAVLTIVLFADLAFVRHRFCATICPYSRMQSTIFDSRTMVLAFDTRRSDECMNCAACTRVCPVDIDIRKGLSPACINCAECMDTCSEMMAKRRRKGLIGYFFGLPAEGTIQVFSFMRRSVLLISFLTLSLLVFLIVLSVGRRPLDMTIMPANNLPPRVTDTGRVVNAYLIAFENRGKRLLQIQLSAADSPVHISLKPGVFSVQPGEHRTTTVFAEAEGLPRNGQIIHFNVTASYDKEQLTARVTLSVPAQ